MWAEGQTERNVYTNWKLENISAAVTGQCLWHILLLKADPLLGICGNYQVGWKGPRAGRKTCVVHGGGNQSQPVPSGPHAVVIHHSKVSQVFHTPHIPDWHQHSHLLLCSIVHQVTQRKLLSPPWFHLLHSPPQQPLCWEWVLASPRAKCSINMFLSHPYLIVLWGRTLSCLSEKILTKPCPATAFMLWLPITGLEFSITLLSFT